MRFVQTALTPLFVLLACCADEEPTVPDGGESAAPRLPQLTPCPPGWSIDGASTESALDWCEPWASGERPTCPEGEGAFVDAGGCARIGPPCPVAGWASDLPDDASILFVEAAGTPTGGDGSSSAPFGTLDEALGAATPGTTLALGRGTFVGGVTLPPMVTLWGTCVEETRIEAPGDGRPAIAADGADAALHNLTLTGEGPGLVVGGAGVQATSVVTRDTTGVGWLLRSRATLRAERVVISGVRDAEPHRGTGIFLEEGASMELMVGVMRGFRLAGIRAVGGPTIEATSVSITDVAITGAEMLDTPGLFDGACINFDRAQLTAVRTLCEEAYGAGLVAEHAQIELADTLVRDTTLQPGQLAFGGYGVRAVEGSELTLRRSVILRAAANGIRLQSSNAAVEDIAVIDTQPFPLGLEDGDGIDVLNGSRMEGSGVVCEGNREISLGVFRSASVELTDVTVLNTRPRDCVADTCADDAAGIGVGSYVGSEVTLQRFVVAESTLAGVQLAQAAMMDLEDGVVSGAPVGANVQVEGYDPSRLSKNVRFEDNGINLDISELPIPSF